MSLNTKPSPIFEIYEPFKVLYPDWSCTRDERIVREYGWLRWNLLKLISFRYKVNPFHPHLLVEVNKWTRPWHFEQDYFREPTRSEVWNNIGFTFEKIANI